MTIHNGSTITPAPTRLPFPEATALFNPALGSIIIAAAAEGHVEDSGRGLPWFGSFLVTPFVLHDPTRVALPPNIRTTLAAWLSRNPVIRDDFSRRANALAPVTRRSIRFGLRAGIMNLEAGQLVPVRRIRGLSGNSGADIRAYYAAARLTGRWMARVDVLTAYNLLGVKL
jgi:hypothetical protein